MSEKKMIDTNLEALVRDVEDFYGLIVIGQPVNLSLGYANENYKLETNKGPFLFRLCKQQPLDLIKFEVQLMGALKKIDFPTAYPVADQQGNFIHVAQPYYWMLFEFKEGTTPVANHEVVTEMGMCTGQLSTLGTIQGLNKKNAVHINTCDQIIAEWERATVDLSTIKAYYIEQSNFLKPFLKEDLPQGIVHGDMFPDNTLFKGNELVAIVDFEEACQDYLLFDVGMTINGFCFKNNVLDQDLMQAFLKAYATKRTLSQKEKELLPIYIQWGAHGMLTWHLRNNLLYTYLDKQLDRVVELKERVEKLRKTNILIE